MTKFGKAIGSMRKLTTRTKHKETSDALSHLRQEVSAAHGAYNEEIAQLKQLAVHKGVYAGQAEKMQLVKALLPDGIFAAERAAAAAQVSGRGEGGGGGDDDDSDSD